jgi:hypothetical protein
MLNLQALRGMTGVHGLYGLNGLGHLSAEPVVTDAPPIVDSSKITKNTIWGLLALASAGASGYHGIKRNHGSIGWGVWWFLMGGLFPVFTPIVAIARKPGFAKPK